MSKLIFIGKRGSGKTTQLIKKSSETGIYILVANRQRQRYVFEKARELGYVIPYPVTVDEYFANRFRGSYIQKDGVYIDDAEDVLQMVFNGIPIRGMTITTQDEFYEL